MGTRHMILVYYKGAYHIAQYGAYDGYPEYTGIRVAAFLKRPGNIDKLKAALDNGMIYTPTEFQMQHWRRELYRTPRDPNVNPQEEAERLRPSLSRKTGVDILELVANATEHVPIIKNLMYVLESEQCEWAYVVDFDKETYEIFAHVAGRIEQQPNSRFHHIICPGENGMPDTVVRSPLLQRGLWRLNALPRSKKRFIRELHW